MDTSTISLLVADAILLVHLLFVIFVVLGLVLIFVGNALTWSWVLNPWFRLIHLVAIGVVIVQSWLNIMCPLTIIEMDLRTRAGDTAYSGSFISHWLEVILYYQAPPWVFIACYTAFGALVVAAWFLVRPRRFSEQQLNGINGK
jgi:hypothetical protein